MSKDSLSIKVCGITRQSDLSTAMGMGAHFCGFIFHSSSPRYISPERVADLDSALVRRVGVFVNQGYDEIASIMETARLDFAQLHGNQTLECARLIGAEKVIRVLWPDRYASIEDLHREMELWKDSCAWFLLDAGKDGGGHGSALNWTELKDLNAPRPWFLAGGLSSGSLNLALEQCHPNGIDLNSGVEAFPGQKSPRKLLAALKHIISYYPTHHIA